MVFVEELITHGKDSHINTVIFIMFIKKKGIRKSWTRLIAEECLITVQSPTLSVFLYIRSFLISHLEIKS